MKQLNLLNSVIVTAMALGLLLVVALPAAYCLSRSRFRGHYLQLAPGELRWYSI